MDGEQETNATPTSFFRGISEKLDSQQHQQVRKASTSSSNARDNYSGTNNSGGGGTSNYGAGSSKSRGVTAMAPTLITQVAQNAPLNVAPRRISRSGGYREANGEARGAPSAHERTTSSTANSTPNTRQRVHATELVERARHIRNQPKNTSPIDASAHPSLLPEALPVVRHKKCLILDVDETLVHSSYESNTHFDVHLPIRLDRDTQVDVYVAFRPHLLRFLEAVSPLFEIVIFTASLSTYCDPLMDAIDGNRILGDLRLFREHCSVVGTTYVKDLSLLGRNLDQVAIIDNSAIAYLFQQRNAIPITSWFDDPNDEELLRLIPVLEALAEADTVYDVLDNYNALLQLQRYQEENSNSRLN